MHWRGLGWPAAGKHFQNLPNGAGVPGSEHITATLWPGEGKDLGQWASAISLYVRCCPGWAEPVAGRGCCSTPAPPSGSRGDCLGPACAWAEALACYGGWRCLGPTQGAPSTWQLHRLSIYAPPPGTSRTAVSSAAPHTLIGDLRVSTPGDTWEGEGRSGPIMTVLELGYTEDWRTVVSTGCD